MRINLRRFIGLIAATAAVLVIGALPAAAQSACEQACEDQFAADVQACDDELAQKLADLAVEEQECAQGNNGNPDGTKGCFNSVAKRRRNAQKQHSQCLRRADNKLRVCLKDCDASPGGSD